TARRKTSCRRVTRPANKFVWRSAKSPASAGFFVGWWLAGVAANGGAPRGGVRGVRGVRGGGRGRGACGGRQKPLLRALFRAIHGAQHPRTPLAPDLGQPARGPPRYEGKERAKAKAKARLSGQERLCFCF